MGFRIRVDRRKMGFGDAGVEVMLSAAPSGEEVVAPSRADGKAPSGANGVTLSGAELCSWFWVVSTVDCVTDWGLASSGSSGSGLGPFLFVCIVVKCGGLRIEWYDVRSGISVGVAFDV